MKINEEVVELLIEQNKTVATAESCTGGLVAKLITDVSGSSAVFDYGIVSYSNEIKWKQLGVNRQTVETYGAVSKQTASEMAYHARLNADADIGVSTTGIAGPTGGTEEKPNGTCFIAVSTERKTEVKKISTFSDDRDYNRNVFARKALEFVKEELDGTE